MASTNQARRMRAEAAARRHERAVASQERHHEQHHSADKDEKSEVKRKHYARDTLAFFAPFVATWAAMFIIAGQGSRLTDLRWVTAWLIVLSLILFLPTRWREVKVAPKAWIATWWPLAGYLVAMVIAYYAGTRLSVSFWLFVIVSAIMFVLLRWRGVVRWFQNFGRRKRKQPLLEEEEPEVIKGNRLVAAVITVIAALIAALIAWPIYLTTPARPFDATNSNTVFTQQCVLVAKDIAVIEQADKAGDIATLKQYNLVKKSDGKTVSFAKDALSNLATKQAAC